jgi:uncharacterized protein YuzE
VNVTVEQVATGTWASYITIAAGQIARTVDLMDATLMVDVDIAGSVLGVEVIGEPVNVGHLIETLRHCKVAL